MKNARINFRDLDSDSEDLVVTLSNGLRLVVDRMKLRKFVSAHLRFGWKVSERCIEIPETVILGLSFARVA